MKIKSLIEEHRSVIKELVNIVSERNPENNKIQETIKNANKIINEKPFLTCHDLASIFNVVVDTIWDWLPQKKISYVRVTKKCVRFEPEAVDEFIKKRTVNN